MNALYINTNNITNKISKTTKQDDLGPTAFFILFISMFIGVCIIILLILMSNLMLIYNIIFVLTYKDYIFPVELSTCHYIPMSCLAIGIKLFQTLFHENLLFVRVSSIILFSILIQRLCFENCATITDSYIYYNMLLNCISAIVTIII